VGPRLSSISPKGMIEGKKPGAIRLLAGGLYAFPIHFQSFPIRSGPFNIHLPRRRATLSP
jgi:hypothetical protein